MRHAIGLALVLVTLILVSRAAVAQDFEFRGADVIKLAETVASTARRTNELPSSFTVPMTNGTPMIIIAPNAYELLARALVGWRQNKTFPGAISLRIHDLQGPAYDPKVEPKRDGLVIAVPAVDIDKHAETWLMLAEAPGHKLPKAMTFETNYQMTAAQIIVTMAIFIEDTIRRGEFPAAVAVPLVRSPKNWGDTRHPVTITQASNTVKVEIIPKTDLQVVVNGIDLSKQGPPQLGKDTLPPFCGVMVFDIAGSGPVEKVRITLDGSEPRDFNGPGPHSYELDTLAMSDGLHVFSATAVDTAGKDFAYVFSFTVMNGRASGITPAERPEVEVEAVPAE